MNLLCASGRIHGHKISQFLRIMIADFAVICKENLLFLGVIYKRCKEMMGILQQTGRIGRIIENFKIL